MLCGFGGWADAASAASGALRYLLLKREGHRIAEFDPDAVYQYTVTRPVTILNEQGGRRLQWPELALHALEVPEATRDLVILLGPEPDLRWRECIGAILALASRLGVSQLVTFGAFLAQVHYAGPPTMVGVSTSPQTRARLRELGISESNYQGPTGFVTALAREASDRGIPSASLWIAAPSYLSNTSNPKLAAALLRAAEKLLGQPLWVEELETAGRDMENRIAEALQSRPDLVSFLRKLGAEPGQPVEPEPESEEQERELPSAQEVLNDLEEYLRKIRGHTDEQPDGNGR